LVLIWALCCLFSAIAASALGLYFQTVQNEATSSNFANALLVT
jgi:hypothetical protein